MLCAMLIRLSELYNPLNKGLSMKKIIILLLALTSSSTFCALRFNPHTKRYYTDASSKVDQNEYHAIVCDLQQVIQPRTFFELTALELAVLFTQLKSIGTPAALQIIRDIEQGIKERNKEVKRIQRL
jgi:hypothetical protein